MLYEARMLREVILLTMLKDKDATLIQQTTIWIIRIPQNQVRNLWQIRQCVWWVGKDKVELPLATLQETEHVTTNE